MGYIKTVDLKGELIVAEGQAMSALADMRQADRFYGRSGMDKRGGFPGIDAERAYREAAERFNELAALYNSRKGKKPGTAKTFLPLTVSLGA